MKNKFYKVYDKYCEEGLCNIVIAKDVKEAKRIGAFVEATECADRWTDIKVEAIKEGYMFFTDEYRNFGFEVIGKGFVYTDLQPQVDSIFNLLENHLKENSRYKEYVMDYS